MRIKYTPQAVLPAKKVFVCGGGHQGLSMAAHLALNGLEVTLWNRTYDNIKTLVETNEINCTGVIKGVAKIKKASSNIEEVFSNFIMVATPSSAHRDIAKKIAPFVNKDTVIVLNPGRTFGAIDFAVALLECGVKELPQIAEMQTIIYTCRRSGANSAMIFALKDDVKIAALGGSDINYIMLRMPKCLRQYLGVVNSVAITSFSNVGMVLHCSPVLMNVGWIETEKVNFKYYYDGISRSVAGFLEKIDAERISIARETGYSIESVADWLKRTYKVNGKNLYECIRNNKAYREIDAPPSLNSRYLTEDVPNGLVPVEAIGIELNVPTPNITTIINLANAVMECDYRKLGRRFSLDILKKYF